MVHLQPQHLIQLLEFILSDLLLQLLDFHSLLKWFVQNELAAGIDADTFDLQGYPDRNVLSTGTGSLKVNLTFYEAAAKIVFETIKLDLLEVHWNLREFKDFGLEFLERV